MNFLSDGLLATLKTQNMLAFAAAMLWGAVSTAMSPCGLTLVPILAGYIRHTSHGGMKRAMCMSLAFTAGVMFTVLIIGLGVCFTGNWLLSLHDSQSIHEIIHKIAAILFFVLGLHLLDIISLPGHHHHHHDHANGICLVSHETGINHATAHDSYAPERASICGALVLGLMSSLAAAPCSIAHFAPVLIGAFTTAQQSAFSIGLILAYGIGHCAVIMAGGLCSEKLGQWLNRSLGPKGGEILSRCCGVIVMLAGLHMWFE